MDLVKSNEGSLTNVVGRYNEDIGDGSSTSITVTHNLNSLDVIVLLMYMKYPLVIVSAWE